MKRFLLNLVVFFCIASSFGQSKYQEDFDYFWETINVRYAYFDDKQTDWNKVKTLYQKRLESIKEDWEFTYTIELMKHELYDPHFGLNRNVNLSFRLIPNALDAYIEIKNGKYYVVDIRGGYAIEDLNVKIGDELVSVNGDRIENVIQWNLPGSIKKPDDAVKEYFANLIFAGRHNKPREIELLRNKNTIKVSLPKPRRKKEFTSLLDSEILSGNIGYIRMNNSLYDNKVIQLFPKAVDNLKETKALIIDLRETHGGGNAEVAKSIMGKFINKEMPYQIHEQVGLEREFGIKRKYIEILTPLENPYRKTVYVLVSRWTGSIGEAIAQGFSNIKNVTVVGTKMAQLLGAVTCEQLPKSGIRFCFPFEKLYNIDGTPRENFTPDVVSQNYKQTYQKVVELLRK